MKSFTFDKEEHQAKIKRNTLIVVLSCAALILAAFLIRGLLHYRNKTEVPVPISAENFFLDTICQITVYDTDGNVAAHGRLDEAMAENAINLAFDRCRELEKTLSRTVSSSDISRINHAEGEWVEVSDDTLYVISAGINYGNLSEGSFDITIGTLTELWDFHADDPDIPDEEAIEEALRHVDYRDIEIDGNEVRLLDPEAKLDLGGIAKGYISDEMAKVLEENGITSAVINLGGNIVAIGNKPIEYDDSQSSAAENSSISAGGRAFKVGIERPYTDRSEIVGFTYASDEIVITSGVYERQFVKDGKIYHHILDPETGYPVETDLDAVSVVAPRGKAMDGDAISTICLIKGCSEAELLIKSLGGFEAAFIKSNGKIKTSPDMNFQAS